LSAVKKLKRGSNLNLSTMEESNPDVNPQQPEPPSALK
jgi:hypothetical protein